jgi:hypothetical protein
MTTCHKCDKAAVLFYRWRPDSLSAFKVGNEPIALCKTHMRSLRPMGQIMKGAVVMNEESYIIETVLSS